MRRKVTGIYGGSFNPIHIGHTTLAKHLLDSGLVDEMWLMVSPQNPLKADCDLLDGEARLALARIGASCVEGLYVSDYEFRLPRPSYMAHTLDCLRRDFQDREFVLVVGADNWERFPRWYRHEEILAHHRILVFPRPGCVLRDLPDAVQAVCTPLMDISATDLRVRMQSPDYHGQGLPQGVWQSIVENGYYGIGKKNTGRMSEEKK